MIIMPDTKQYGKQYNISPQAATKPDKIKSMIYNDIIETLLKNDVLIIYSELLPNGETFCQWEIKIPT